jgi:metal-responsive CopG/Arc/MetJ family transcriptional regulator
MFSSSVKVKIDKQLWDKLTKISELAGYSSAEEFVIHALEKEVAQIEEAETDEEVREKLKGLGYIS